MAMHCRKGHILLATLGLACVLTSAPVASAQTPASVVSTQDDKKPTPVVIVSPVPVPVLDAERVAREPFQMSTVSTFFPTSFASTDVVAVPAGKRLVIEYASGWINSGGAGGLLAANLSSGPGLTNTLSCLPQGQNALNFIFVCAGPIRQYVEPGATLVFNFQTFAANGGFYRVFVNGYYEPVP